MVCFILLKFQLDIIGKNMTFTVLMKTQPNLILYSIYSKHLVFLVMDRTMYVTCHHLWDSNGEWFVKPIENVDITLK